MIIHTNPLQEVMQPEGTPQFHGSLEAIHRLARELPVPVIVKETGCGFSQRTLERLNDSGIAAVDVAGFGGTHWGRVEGSRSQPQTMEYLAAETFKDWGIGTVDSLLNGLQAKPDYQLWASGGVRSGLDAAKLLAVGADMVGFAKPLMEAALLSTEAILQKMEQYEHELKIALFCTGAANIASLQSEKHWHWSSR
jgi:isopentenyl-diphosphate delta-isomerase